MFLQTVTPGSLIVGDTCQYTFNFQITDAVPGNGRIYITFPIGNQISIPNSLTTADVTVSAYGTSVSTFTLTLTQVNIIEILNAFGGVSLSVDPIKFIVVTINRIQNPTSMMQTNSFKLQTLDGSGNQIDIATTAMTVQMTTPATLLVVSGYPAPMAAVVRSFTSITFDVIQTISYNSVSYIQVTFPAEIYLQESTLNCVLMNGFTDTSDQCTMVSSSPQIVQITDSLTDYELQFQIGYAINPSSSKPTSNFQIGIFDGNNNLISTQTSGMTYQATPDVVSQVTATRGLTQISLEQGNSLTLTFTASNFLNNGEYFLIRIPFDQMQADSTTFTCQSSQGTDAPASVPCTLDTLSSSVYFIVTMQVPCPVQCSDGTSYNVVFSSGVFNPHWIADTITSTLQIQTMISDLLWIRDEILSGVQIGPDLTEGIIGTYSIAKGNPIVNQVTSIIVGFTTLNNIPANGIVRIYLPPYSFYLPLGSAVSCLSGGVSTQCTSSLYTDNTQGIQYIELTNVCPVACPSVTTLQFSIANMLNRPSIRPIQNSFFIRTYTSQYYRIDLATVTDATGLALQTASYSSIYLTSPVTSIVTGAISVYTFKFTSVNGLVPNSLCSVQVIFPSEVVLGSSSTCSASVVSTQTSLSCSLDPLNQQLVITNSDPVLTFANLEITVIVSGHNPQTSKPSSKFVVQTQLFDTVDQRNYLVDYDAQTLVVTADTPNILSDITVIRDVLTINMPTDLTVTFTTFNPVPKGSQIQVSIPVDQLVISTTSTLTYTDTVSGSSITQLGISGVQQSSQPYQTIVLKEWCSNGQLQCSAASTLSFKMSGANNGPSTRPGTLSFKLEIFTSDGYFTDQLISGIYASPQMSAGPFESISFSQSSSIVGDLIVLTIQAIVSNPITPGNTGQLLVLLPSQLLYQDDTNPVITCALGGQSTPCISTTSISSIGTYFASFTITMDCATYSCLSGIVKTFTVSTLRNRFSTKPMSGSIQISTLDDEGYAFDSSSVQLGQTALPLVLTLSSQGQFFSFASSSSIVSQATIMTIQFMTSTRMSTNSLLNIMIPKDSFIQNSVTSITCLNPTSSQSLDCTLSSSNSLYFVIQMTAFCTAGANGYCLDDTTLNLQVSGFANRYNTMPGSTTFMFTSQTSDLYYIEQSGNTLLPQITLQPATGVINNDYTLSSSVVGMPTSFTMNLGLTNQILTNDYLLITFSQSSIFRTTISSPQCTISSLSNLQASSVSTSSTTNGQLSSISLQLPFNQMNGQNVQVTVLNLLNLLESIPFTTTIGIQAYTLASDGVTQYQISQASLTMNSVQILTPSPFSSIGVTRNQTELEMNTALTVSFQTPISIMSGSSLTLQVPKPQAQYSGQQLSIITYNVFGITAGVTLTEDSNYIYLVTPSSICMQTTSCPIATTLSFTIASMVNPPYQQLNQLSFALIITSPNGYKILDSTGTAIIAVPSLKVGTIDQIQILQTGSLVTMAPTVYDFIFRIPQTLGQTFQLIIQVPDATLIPSTTDSMTCIDKVTKNTFKCIAGTPLSTNGYIVSITISDFCTISSCQQASIHSIQITNINNVDYARSRQGIFNLMTTSPQGYLTAQGTYPEMNNLSPFIVQTLSNFTVTRETTSVGQINVDLILSFVAPTKIPDGSSITYFLPLEQQIFQSTTHLTCISLTQTKRPLTLSCTVIVCNSTFMVLTVNEWCTGSCQALSVMTMKIKNTNNPSTLAVNDATYSYGLLIQNTKLEEITHVYSGIYTQPQLAGIPFNYTQVSRANSVLGQDENLTVTFVMQAKVIIPTNLTIQIPLNSSFPSSQIPFTCFIFSQGQFTPRYCMRDTYANAAVYGSSPFTNVTIVNFCNQTSPCLANSMQVIKVGMSNPRSSIGIQTQYNVTKYNVTLRSYSLDVGRFTLYNTLTQYVTNQIIPTVSYLSSDCALTGYQCQLTISIKTSNPFQASLSSFLLITVPQEVQLSTLSTCNASLFDIAMQCKIISSQQQIQLRYNQSVNDSIMLLNNFQFQINLTVNSIRNPYSTQATSNFTIATYEIYNFTNYMIDQLKVPLVYPSVEPSTFSMITVTRTNLTPVATTNLQINLTVGNKMIAGAQFLIIVPDSQVMIKAIPGSNPQCISTLQKSQKGLACSISQDQTISVKGICQPNGCSTGQNLSLLISDTFIYNPQSQKPVYDPQQDSVQVTAYFQVGAANYLYQRSLSGIYVTPKLNMSGGITTRTNSTLDKLLIQNLTFSTSVLSEFQVLQFNARYNLSSLFSQDNLRVKFFNISFTVDQFYGVTVQIENQTVLSQVQMKTNIFGETVLDQIWFPCEEQWRTKSQLRIKVLGFRNPSYVSNSGNQLQMPQLQFAEMFDPVGTIYQQATANLTQFIISQKSSSALNHQVSFHNYSLGATQNTLSMLFSIPNNPNMDPSATISVKLPSGYAISTQPNCTQLFSGQHLDCNSQNGQVTLLGYFSQASGQIGRRVLDTLPSYTSDSLTVVAISIGNITNPKIISQNQTLTVSVQAEARIYIFDNSSMSSGIYSITQNCNGNCSICNSLNQSQCFQCLAPSSSPLLQDYQCRNSCSIGYFEFDQKCFKCPFGCQQCQTYDQCSSCESLNQELVDVTCLDMVNNVGEALQCPQGTNKSQEYGCVSELPCGQTECLLCGVDVNYCHKCINGYSSYFGICMTQCPAGFTSRNGYQCQKCDLRCQTCQNSPQECSSCRDDLFSGLLLDLKTKTCSYSCSQGTLLRLNDPKYCDICDAQCNTCSVAPDNCTSCSVNRDTQTPLYYSEGKCQSSCQFGQYLNPEEHLCQLSYYSLLSAAPIFLILTLTATFLLLIISKLVTRYQDSSQDIAIFSLTQIEALNRIVLIAVIWETEYLGHLSVLGMNLLANSVLGLYFHALVMEPICKNIKKQVPTNSRVFQALMILTQLTGSNTMRLVTSQFMNLEVLSTEKLLSLHFYVSHLETMSMISGIFNLTQILVCISIIFKFSLEESSFGFAVNSLILNPLLVILILIKYRKYKILLSQYQPMRATEQGNNQGQSNALDTAVAV